MAMVFDGHLCFLCSLTTCDSSVRVVVSCDHGTQDVCKVNKVRKYHSMCETVVSAYVAVETQRRIF